METKVCGAFAHPYPENTSLIPQISTTSLPFSPPPIQANPDKIDRSSIPYNLKYDSVVK